MLSNHLDLAVVPRHTEQGTLASPSSASTSGGARSVARLVTPSFPRLADPMDARLPPPLTVVVATERSSTSKSILGLLSTLVDVEVVGTAHEVAAALRETKRLRPDLVIVDAADAKAGGLSIAASLDRAEDPSVIVVSPNKRFAASAFEVAALDYLVAPFERERVLRAVARARLRCAERRAFRAAGIQREEPTIYVPDRNGGRDVALCDVIWIRADRDYAQIYTRERTHMLRCTMGRLADRLPARIPRVHRSAFVALNHVRRWKKPRNGAYALQLSDGTEVPVGPNYLGAVRAKLRSLEE